MPRIPADRQKSWLLLIEFSCHADAQAARELLSDLISEEMILRPKLQFPSAANIASWRITQRLRNGLGSRTFGREEVDAVCLANGYQAKNNLTWLTAATKARVIERLARGEYRFLPLPTGAVASSIDSLPRDPRCAACQPEALSP